MVELDVIKNEYERALNFNKSNSCIHNIDIEKYEADCSKFFKISKNCNLYISLSNQANYAENESEITFENWLKKG